ncbi:MAG: hypothetical protein ACRENM_01375 [Candidatus Dormibacteraceae bacterium]
MEANQPNFVGSMFSGVDGSSEGGRLTTSRFNSTMTLFAVSLADAIRRGGQAGKVQVTPELTPNGWILSVAYDGTKPKQVPNLWCGRPVRLEKMKAPSA